MFVEYDDRSDCIAIFESVLDETISIIDVKPHLFGCCEGCLLVTAWNNPYSSFLLHQLAHVAGVH